MILPSRLLVLVVTTAFAAGLRVPETVQYLPFAASLVLFGLPHGALDHLVPARLAGRPATTRDLFGVGLLYVCLGGAVLALWSVAPAAAFVLFVSVTVFHWGTGDLHALVSFGPAGLGAVGRPTRIFLSLVRGAIPMLVPLLAFPGDYRAVASETSKLFGESAAGIAWIFSPPSRVALGTALAVLLMLSLLSAARDLPGGRRRAALSLSAETLLLVLFFAVVPPVLAVGLYFTLWHAPQHIARLVLLDRPGRRSSRAGCSGTALVRFGRDAAPLTAVALGLLAVLSFVAPGTSGSPGSLLALYLVLVSALTIPHTAVVWYMDRRQGIW